MNYLILSQPSEDYAQAVSHELWMLARPRGISDNETSQYFCGVLEHSDGRVAIGPLDGSHPVHVNADELSFGHLIGAAITDEEEVLVGTTVSDAKGGSIDIVAMIQQLPSISPNLRTYEQLDTEGWINNEEGI